MTMKLIQHMSFTKDEAFLVESARNAITSQTNKLVSTNRIIKMFSPGGHPPLMMQTIRRWKKINKPTRNNYKYKISFGPTRARKIESIICIDGGFDVDALKSFVLSQCQQLLSVNRN